MRFTFPLTMFGVAMVGVLLCAQTPRPPWRGAGPQPCIGSDGGAYQCPPAPRTVAVRAGHLFDSKSGQMLTKQVVLIRGERIADVGSETNVAAEAFLVLERCRSCRLARVRNPESVVGRGSWDPSP